MYLKWYTVLYLDLIFFMPVSYGVKTAKKHKINFKLSKIEHSKKYHLKTDKKVQILSTKILKYSSFKTFSD